jgi:hypothetical protein
MNGKRIMVMGAALLGLALLMGVVGNVVFGQQEGGAANVTHLAQMALLALGVVAVVVGAVTRLATGRREPA